jgi:hypothetical protein
MATYTEMLAEKVADKIIELETRAHRAYPTREELEACVRETVDQFTQFHHIQMRPTWDSD